MSFLLSSFAHRLCSHIFQVSVELDLLAATRMMLEVVEAFGMVLDEVIVKDSVLLSIQVIILIIVTLVAAACGYFK